MRALWVAALVGTLVCGAAVAQDAPAASAAPSGAVWKSEVELGYSGSRGTTLSDNLRAAYKSTRKTDGDRLKLDATYNFATTRGIETTSDGTAGGLLDLFFHNSPAFAWVDGRYDYDRFGSWDHRFSTHGGLGRDLIKRADLTLTARAGLGVLEALDDNNAAAFEAVLGAEGVWQFRKGQEIGGSIKYLPSLNDPVAEDYRVLGSIYWKANLSGFDAMSVKVGADHEYESNAVFPNMKHDSKLYAAVVMGF